jgi:hypothetical protein
MTKHVRGRNLASRPFTPESLKPAAGWVGVPGARHIPAPSDPVFPALTGIVADWTQAGIEMTDELMAAAVKLATTQVERRAQRKAIEEAQKERHANAATSAPPPGFYGDAPNAVVYYVRRDRYVKIGTTTQLQDRMRGLMPDEVLALEPGSYTLEGELHKRFAHLRVRPNCEYFLLDDELRAHIAVVVDRVGPPPSGLDIKDFLGEAS